MKAFWWRPEGFRNFGDELTPYLLDHFGLEYTRTDDPRSAELAVTGSIASLLGEGCQATILGIGKGRNVPIDLSQANVLALRGDMTLADSGAKGDVVLGDPGLLVSDVVEQQSGTSTVVLPHWRDFELRHRYPDAKFVDPTWPPDDVVRSVAAASRVIASSLHGIVVADAFGLPRKWEPHSQTQGGGFKFYDYATALGQAIEPGRWQTANPWRVADIQTKLRELFSQLSQVD